MDSDTDQIDGIEACRTCGIYFMSSTNYLKPIFQSPVENPEMMHIRLELSQWKVEMHENDGLPQHVCGSCIHEFQRVFKFRSSCIQIQEQLRTFYHIRETNLANIKIKTELVDPEEETPQCNFIYVDDLSDGENDTVTPFNIPHMPIKEERIEEATIPQENGTEAVCIAESASEGSATAPLVRVMPAEITPQPKQPPVQPVECQLCQHLSPNPEEHKHHLQRVHEVRDMECHICGKVFKNSTQSRFRFHLKWHNINKHVKCAQCGFVCSSNQALKEHKRAVHAKIQCKICGKGIIAKKMKNHLRKHEILAKFPCEYCNEAFHSEEERVAHIWQIHAHEESSLTNKNITNESYIDQDNVRNNGFDESQNVNHEVLSLGLICAQCDEKFSEQSDLVLHVQEVHHPKFSAQEVSPEYKTLDAAGYSNVVEQQQNVDVQNSITVFEDYDDETDEELDLPPNDTQYTNTSLLNNDNSLHFHNTQNFTQYRSSLSNNNLDNDDDDEDEVNIGKQQKVFNEQAMERMETTSSVGESDSESNSSASYVSHDVTLPFACAKCPKRLATIEQLRSHYQQHQDQTDKSPSKSKFICNICDKVFDLKFSLNRHMKKHKDVAQ